MSDNLNISSNPDPQPVVTADEPAGSSVKDPVTEPGEKQVPVGEAIRYRKRAQAAEKQLAQLRQEHEQQGEQFAALKEEVEKLKAAEAEQLSASTATVQTQGVKESRTGGARTKLQTAARQAAVSGSRADVQEYLRLRRNFV